MQHPPELKTKFLELRARGLSYGQIAEAIGVSKPTLIQWGKSMAEEIADLQAAERELVREKLLGNFEQWLGRQVHHFNRLDEEFGRRQFKYSPTESVFRMMMASRKLLDRYFFDDPKPARRGSSEGRAPSSPPAPPGAQTPLPRAAETKSLGRSKDHPQLGQNEGQTGSSCSLRPSELSTQNSELCADGRTGAPPTDESSTDSLNPQPSTLNFSPPAPSRPCVETPESEPPDQQSDTDSGDNSVAGKFIFALRRLQACEADSPSESVALCADRAGSQSEIRNPKSEIESASAPPRLCVETQSVEPSVETQNPAKTLPFPCQNWRSHNSNLSRVAEGRAILPHSAESHNYNPNLNPDLTPPRFCGEVPENPSKTQPFPHQNCGGSSDVPAGDEPQADDPALEGESIPIGPHESTREWLARQGISVSKISKTASSTSA